MTTPPARRNSKETNPLMPNDTTKQLSSNCYLTRHEDEACVIRSSEFHADDRVRVKLRVTDNKCFIFMSGHITIKIHSAPRIEHFLTVKTTRTITLGNFTCNLSRNAIAIQVARNIAQCDTTLQRPKTLPGKLQKPLRKLRHGSSFCKDFKQRSASLRTPARCQV